MKPTPVPEQSYQFDLRPAAEAATALTRQQQALALVVRDQPSHEFALEFISGVKALRRKIVEHWQPIKRNVDTLKKSLLDLERKDLGPVDEAIERAERTILDYVQIEVRRQAEDRERQRLILEAQAQKDRTAELAKREAEAERLEAQSPALSAREAKFVTLIIFDADDAGTKAGYKDGPAAAARLLATPKIIDAIATQRAALAVREQAEALRQAPLENIAPKVDSRLGHVAGTSVRTTFKAEVVNHRAFEAAYISGKIPAMSMEVNQTYLNQQATALKDQFETAFPGCRLVKTQTIAG